MTTTAGMPPRYVHDCDRCRYLGRFRSYDLYVCETKSLSRQSVIARYSDEPSGYASGDVEVWRNIQSEGVESTEALHAAIVRAEASHV